MSFVTVADFGPSQLVVRTCLFPFVPVEQKYYNPGIMKKAQHSRAFRILCSAAMQLFLVSTVKRTQ